MQGVPNLEQVRAWVGVPTTALSDEDLQQILDAELAIQARLLRLPEDPDPETGLEATYPEPLARSCLRRCQRQVAARNVPLGVLGAEGAEFGPLTMPSWDVEVARLEASYRMPVIA